MISVQPLSKGNVTFLQHSPLCFLQWSTGQTPVKTPEVRTVYNSPQSGSAKTDVFFFTSRRQRRRLSLCPLPWCPCNARTVEIDNFLIHVGCPLPWRKYLGALALSKTKHDRNRIVKICSISHFSHEKLFLFCLLL